MFRSLPALLLVTSALTFACSAEQVARINAASIQAKSGSAIKLATSATIAQMALFHLAAAVSRAATEAFDSPDAAPMVPASGPDAEFAYQVNTAARTGRITRFHEGKRVVDLEFAFESEGANAGVAYAVTRTSGQFEGYQFFFPRLRLVYSAMLDEAFNPLKHENGNWLINVAISANGSLGIAGVETAHLSKAEISLTYPISEREGRVGEVALEGRDGSTFAGEVHLATKAIQLTGAVKDANGVLAYELNTTPNGELSLAAPAASPASP